MFGPTFLRDIFLTAGFELREMLRSRRMFLFGTLYLLVAALGSYGFVQFLIRMQPITNQVTAMNNRGPLPPLGSAARPRPPAPPLPAADANTPSQAPLFQRGSPFRGMLRDAVTEQSAVDFLLSKPPITLFHMLVSLSLLPFLIMLTSAETIAQEHQSRGVRFVALRTGRAEFVIGKVCGQALTIGALTLLGGLVCLAVARWKLADFEFWPALSATVLFWPRILAYCVAYLGLAALCSMNSSSTTAARIFSLVAMTALWIAHHLFVLYQVGLDPAEGKARLWQALDFLTPYAHENDLWYPALATYGGAMAALVALGAFFTGIGLIVYRDRDL